MVLLEVLDMIHHEKNCEKLLKNMKECVNKNIYSSEHIVSRTFMIDNVDLSRCKDYKSFVEFSRNINISIKRNNFNSKYNINYDKENRNIDIK